MKKQTNNIIPIFFATDDNYMPFLRVALQSITKNTSKNNKYEIYVLNTGLKEENIENLKKFDKENISVKSVNIEEKIKDFSNRLHTRDYYSKSTYYRLFIPTMFPQYDKALYLDSDIVVLSDIANLYNINVVFVVSGVVSVVWFNREVVWCLTSPRKGKAVSRGGPPFLGYLLWVATRVCD